MDEVYHGLMAGRRNAVLFAETDDRTVDEVYLGATLFEKDGKTMVRFISFRDNDKSQNTVKEQQMILEVVMSTMMGMTSAKR